MLHATSMHPKQAHALAESIMTNFKTFLRSGHAPTLFASFLYFDFTFAIWVLNGAMAPFISESFHLTPAQKGFMISVPILAGALMRFPLGVLSQYIGRKSAALVEMALVAVALLYGFLFVDTHSEVLAMGVLLGIAGGSFGIALSLGSGWFPPKYKGLAMGIAGAGNSGTVLAVLLAPPLATRYGWQAVYGLFEKDGWAFSLIYVITFGGFIGLANFLPTYFYDQFKVTKIEAGQLTMLATLMGSATRVVGGYVSDRFGGINALTGVLSLVIVTLVICGTMGQNLAGTTLLFMLCFAALGAGNGALFQLVPLRWPLATAVAGSMIGEVGALGGGFIPNAMGMSKQHFGTYFYGFAAFAVLGLGVLLMMRVMQIRWTRTWAEKGGRARSTSMAPKVNTPRRT